jgi:carboxyl-terminal processing protease
LRVFQQSVDKWLSRGLVAVLIVVGSLTAPVLADTSSDYEALRLLSEALNEISTKAVFLKNDTELYKGAMRGLMNSLDPDSSYLSPEQYAKYQQGQHGPTAEAGMELIFKDHLLTAVSVLDGGPADRAGLKAGDHITKIDGHLIRNTTTQEGEHYFQGAAGKTLKLEVIRNGLVKPLELSVTLEPLGPPIPKVKMLDGGYAYIRLPYFSNDLPKTLSHNLNSLLKGTPPVTGLILDLRNNARGSLDQAVRTASLFLGNRKVVSTRGRQSKAEQTYQGADREQVLKNPLPLVVLVDQGTARGAEILAGALQDNHRAILLGDKTFGLCGINQVIPLEDGSALLMTTAYCYTPGGQKISGDGLKPDIEAQKPSETDTKVLTAPTPAPEADPWVQQAVEILKGGKAPTS